MTDISAIRYAICDLPKIMIFIACNTSFAKKLVCRERKKVVEAGKLSEQNITLKNTEIPAMMDSATSRKVQQAKWERNRRLSNARTTSRDARL